jgi:hypothetical protein
MPLTTWLALAFLLAVAVVGTVVTVLRARDLRRTASSVSGVLGRGFDEVGRRTAALEARVAAAGESSAELDAALARLRASRARAVVLASAVAEARHPLARVRALVPRK